MIPRVVVSHRYTCGTVYTVFLEKMQGYYVQVILTAVNKVFQGRALSHLAAIISNDEFPHNDATLSTNIGG